MKNLFADLPAQLPSELVTVLAQHQHARIERIVSTGHSSPDGFWYDQDESEWVVVLSGEAIVRFDGDEDPITLTPGDHLSIPAHRKHRVEWTTPAEPTVWLAVFIKP
ncbi:cupin domain-containing protein [Allorhodopirellula heiligendammensis]|uniref:Cupin domain protein n=1 Tax=Allorhodopirellula heiligendammensis TaxID=2714739 RepID=A0A5C6BU82_9BACT|nr:cupin domain-containing protein [Allorhodopirellula heiligendammensis]TWU15565.1 Cupin domain protein [Allorhodopirellula heiligendammensis]|tara:strand:- start:1586 stop:1906 length:321 start_codon:yes stop_codon:yes gene_type:complete